MRPLLLLPEMLLFVGGLGVLLGGSFLPRDRQWVARIVAAAVLVGSIAVSALALSGDRANAFEGTFVIDTGTGVARLVASAGTLFVLALAGDELAGTSRESETYALLLFSTAGTLVLAGAQDLLVLTAGFLLASIPLYALIGLARGPRAAEAAMKTYLMGALFGIFLMLGVTILYAVSGSTVYPDLAATLADVTPAAVGAGLLAVLAGLLFEAGGVPGHFWVPDAAQGTSGTVATFLTTVPKIGAIVAIYRLVLAMPDTVAWPLLVALLAVASMTLGNLAAYAQQDPRRLVDRQPGRLPARARGSRWTGGPRPALAPALPGRLHSDQHRRLRRHVRPSPPARARGIPGPVAGAAVAGGGAGRGAAGSGGHPTHSRIRRQAHHGDGSMGRRNGVAGGRAPGELAGEPVLLPALDRAGVRPCRGWW